MSIEMITSDASLRVGKIKNRTSFFFNFRIPIELEGHSTVLPPRYGSWGE